MFRTLLALAFMTLTANVSFGQFGGPNPTTCSKQNGHWTCQILYQDRPTDTYCNGTCSSDQCPIEEQVQAVSAEDWADQVIRYRAAKVGEFGIETVANTPKLCYTRAPCKCVEDAEGDGDCYADLFTIYRHEITRFAIGDPCDGIATD